MTVELSVVVPVYNEQDNVVPLLREIVTALTHYPEGEVIFVDDFSHDETLASLAAVKQDHDVLRVIAHDQNCGQSSAIRTGVLAARGRLIVVLDGDGQNDPADIPKLIDHYLQCEQKGGVGMVSGRRVKRQDSMTKRLASKVGNRVRQWILRDKALDAGCGLKVFTRETFIQLPYFDHMHRYMATLMSRHGLTVEFIDVNHRPRRFGRSKYGVFDRLWVGLGDILGVVWLNRRCRLPGKSEEL